MLAPAVRRLSHSAERDSGLLTSAANRNQSTRNAMAASGTSTTASATPAGTYTQRGIVTAAAPGFMAFEPKPTSRPPREPPLKTRATI